MTPYRSRAGTIPLSPAGSSPPSGSPSPSCLLRVEASIPARFVVSASPLSSPLAPSPSRPLMLGPFSVGGPSRRKSSLVPALSDRVVGLLRAHPPPPSIPFGRIASSESSMLFERCSGAAYSHGLNAPAHSGALYVVIDAIMPGVEPPRPVT